MDVFAALADPTRREIVEMLARQGPTPASEIASRFPMSAPAVSQHLKVLREAQVLLVEKKAQQRIYQVNPAAMAELEGWTRRLRERLDEQFDTLDRVLAEEQQLQPGSASKKQEGDDG